MIRLSTAHAKCRLCKTIDIEDAQAAVELVQFAYFKKVWCIYHKKLSCIYEKYFALLYHRYMVTSVNRKTEIVN